MTLEEEVTKLSSLYSRRRTLVVQMSMKERKIVAIDAEIDARLVNLKKELGCK